MKKAQSPAVASEKKAIKQFEALEPVVLSDTEKAISRAEVNLSKVKHIDALDLARNHIFPLLRKLAHSVGDHDQQIEDLAEALADDGTSDTLGQAYEALAAARDLLIGMDALLGRALVAAGYFKREPSGLLIDTGVGPEDVRKDYQTIVADAVEVVTDVQSAMDAIDGEGDDDGDEDEDEDEGDDGDEFEEDEASGESGVESDDHSGEPEVAAAVVSVEEQPVAAAEGGKPNTAAEAR